MRQRKDPESPELNLAPIMNIVIILIPMLLLAVVFLSAGVINVSTPKLGPVEATADVEEGLELTVIVAPDGFAVKTSQGTTRVAADPAAASALAESASKYSRGDRNGGERALNAAMAAYDWSGLYAEAARIKRANPGHTEVRVTADDDIPYAVIVSVMDALRWRLDDEAFSSSSAFWAANTHTESRRGALFPDAVLALPRH